MDLPAHAVPHGHQSWAGNLAVSAPGRLGARAGRVDPPRRMGQILQLLARSPAPSGGALRASGAGPSPRWRPRESYTPARERRSAVSARARHRDGRRGASGMGRRWRPARTRLGGAAGRRRGRWQFRQRVTGRWVTVTGKRTSVLITSHDAGPVRGDLALPGTTRAPRGAHKGGG